MKTYIRHLLTALLLLCTAAVQAQSGQAGSIYWTLTDSTLTIEGTGTIPDYFYSDSQFKYYIKEVRHITIEEGITGIGVRSFGTFTGLESIDIPASVTTIGNRAFFGCSSLKSITIPDGVTAIEEKTFDGCYALTTATIGDGVTTIGPSAFVFCSKLTDVTIGKGLTTINDKAFYGCRALNNFTIRSSSAPTLGSEVFYNIPATATLHSLTWGYSSSANSWWSLFGNVKYIAGQDITWEIKDGCLYLYGSGRMCDFDSGEAPWYDRREEIDHFSISDDITYIGHYAFEYMKFTSQHVYFSEINTDSIGSGAFYNTEILVIKIGKDVKHIGPAILHYCDVHTIYVDDRNTVYDSREASNAIIETATNTLVAGTNNSRIPSSVTKIGHGAFGTIWKSEECKLPETITSIGDNAFMNNPNLKKITLGSNLTYIGIAAFAGCDSLESIISYVPADKLSAIEFKAHFMQSFGKTTLYVPYGAKAAYEATDGWNRIKNIVEMQPCGENATWIFKDGTLTINGSGAMTDYGSGTTPWNDYNKQIKQVIIEHGITSIGVRAFNSCTSLESISIPESVTKIGHRAFFGCSALKSITIPKDVTSIEEKTFDGCGKLAEIKFGDRLQSIKNSAFNGNRSLTSITLPASLRSIDTKAFNFCTNLVEIKMNGVIAPTVVADAFANINASAALHLPIGRVKNYQQAGWTMFTNIISPCPISLTINDATMGSATLSADTVNYGSSVTVQVTPAEDYVLKSITVNDTDITGDSLSLYTYTIENIENVTTVAVEFEKGIIYEASSSNVSAILGESIAIPLVITNSEPITALQFDVVLPEGTIGSVSLATQRANGHNISTSSYVDNNRLRVVAYSAKNASFRGNSGEIATIYLTGVDRGTSTVLFENITIVTADRNELILDNVQSTITVNSHIMGDANMNGSVSISDVVAAINYALEQAPAQFNLAAADINGDGEITIIDIVKIVNIIMNGGSTQQSTRSYKRAEATTENISMEAAGEAVTIALPEGNLYTALQMDVELPAGASLKAATAGEHTVTWNTIADGKVRIIAYSLSGETFAADAHLSLEIEGADGTVAASNILACTPEGVETAIGGSSADINGTTGIGGTAADGAEVVSVRYFTEAGAELSEPREGINIVVTQYADGKVESKKVIVKK